MTERAALIDRERRKLAWLKEKVAEQERRLRALEDLGDDPLDEMFERELNATAPVQTPALPPAQPSAGASLAIPSASTRASLNTLLQPLAASAWTRRPRQLPPNWVRILEFLGREGKTYAEVKDFIASAGLPISAEAVRTGLMNYRKDFGLVENPERGFYKATDRAMEIIEAQKDESPAVSDNEASESQPA